MNAPVIAARGAGYSELNFGSLFVFGDCWLRVRWTDVINSAQQKRCAGMICMLIRLKEFEHKQAEFEVLVSRLVVNIPCVSPHCRDDCHDRAQLETIHTGELV